jgi:pimeloyl-ACP methyl ester carboxylesterase
MDSWDPLFLDELATSFKVVIFDYSGLGASTGTATYDRATLAKDAKDLIDYLGFKKVAIGGWSLGGVVAQTFTLAYPELVSHTVLIGTAPPGHQKIAGEPLFIKTAMNPVNTLEDEFVLFFDPTSQRSNLAARRSHERIAQRTTALSPPIPVETFMKLLGQAKDPSTIYPDPDGSHSAWLASGACPILVISGDRDIACPVENWLELVKDWKSLYVVTVPQAGHAPHHQEPEFCAETIKTFVTKIR